MGTIALEASGIVRQLTGVALGSGGYPGVALYEWTDAGGPGVDVSTNATISSSAHGNWSVVWGQSDSDKKYVVKLWNREDTSQVRYVPVTETHTFKSISVGTAGLYSQGTIFVVATDGNTTVYLSSAGNVVADGVVYGQSGLDATTAVASVGGLVVATTATISTLAVQTALALPTGSVTAPMIANRTRTLFVPITTTVNTVVSTALCAAAMVTLPPDVLSYASGVFAVPIDFVSTLNVVALTQCREATAMRLNLTAYYAQTEEDIGMTHANSSGLTTVTPAVDQVQEVLTVSVASANVGDYVVLNLYRAGTDGLDVSTDSVVVLGFIASYTADS